MILSDIGDIFYTFQRNTAGRNQSDLLRKAIRLDQDLSRLFMIYVSQSFDSLVSQNINLIKYIFISVAMTGKNTFAQGVWITSTKNGLFMIICHAVLMK